MPFRQYPVGSVLGRRGGGGQPLNREPLIDVLRPGLIVSAIVAVSETFKAFLLAGIYKNLLGAEFIRETFSLCVEWIAADDVSMHPLPATCLDLVEKQVANGKDILV